MLILLAISLISFMPSTAAQGTSTITISNSSVHILVGMYSGTVAYVTYTINLRSGTSGRTGLEPVGVAALTSNGITVNASAGQQDPPYSGNLIVVASPTAKLGNYSLVLSAYGADPSVSNVTLEIVVSQAAPTTIPTTVVISNGTSQEAGIGAGTYIGVALVVIIVIAGVAYAIIRRRSDSLIRI